MKRVQTRNRYLIFLGCAIPYRVTAYEVSARKVLEKLGVDLVEMPEFNCCGLPMDSVDHEMMLRMAATNLAVAERQQLNIVTLCTGCAGTLRKVNRTLKEDSSLRKQTNTSLRQAGIEFKGLIEVKHLVQVLVEDIGLERIKEAVVDPLMSLSVAEHNGCHMLRPRQYSGFDDPEDPKMLKQLIQVTGAKCLDYIDETECCGAPSIGINDKIPLRLTRDKLLHVKAVGSQALITICPFCHMMYDMNQGRIEKMFNEKYCIPVLHYPQLLGLAMGFTPEELAMNELRIDWSKILEHKSTEAS